MTTWVCRWTHECISARFLAGFLTVMLGAAAGKTDGAEPEVLIERIEKVHSDGQWNGRPGIVYWKDRYYISFRTGAEHSSADGRIRLLTSRPQEARGWTVSDVVDTPNDNAEAHLLATEDRLFIYVPMEDAETTKGDPIHTIMSWTDDGVSWSDPVRVYQQGFSLWKPVTHDGIHFAAADIMTGEKRVELVHSKDGVEWQKVSTILSGNYTETALLFLKDHMLLAFTRQGKVSLSQPPYTKWESHAGIGLGGPAAALVGNTVVVGGRTSTKRHPDDQPGTSRTGLFRFDPATLKFQHKMNMITQWGRDDSYPHFLTLDDQRVLMVWYTGQGYERGVAKQADLFFARLRIQ